MSIALIMPGRATDDLVARLAKRLRTVTVDVWPALSDPGSVSLAVLWKQPPEALASLAGLRAVMSYGAGVDFILEDPTIDPALPVARFADPALGAQVASYVLAQVLSRVHRLAHFRECQARRHWDGGGLPSEARVAVLGLGTVGGAIADAFHRLGHRVAGWASRPRPRAPYPVFSGTPGLREVVGRADYVVCALPATAATRALLDAALFAAFRPGATLVNVGRGEQLREADLLPALDRGRPAAAILDVFSEEPLRETHPFWADSRITITPHVAGLTDPARAVEAIARCHEALEAGAPLPGRVDRQRGY